MKLSVNLDQLILLLSGQAIVQIEDGGKYAVEIVPNICPTCARFVRRLFAAVLCDDCKEKLKWEAVR